MLPTVDLYFNDDAYQVKALINLFCKSSITRYRNDKNWKCWLAVERKIRVLIDLRLFWLPTGDFLFKSTIFVLTISFLVTHICFVFVLFSRKIFSKNMSFDLMREDSNSNTSTNTCVWKLYIYKLFLHIIIYFVFITYYKITNILNNWEVSKCYVHK